MSDAPEQSPPTYFTTAQVARYCAVDVKTIHNWVDKGKLSGFRTPGRHLRFKPATLHAFLIEYGYDVPCEVTAALPSDTEKAA